MMTYREWQILQESAGFSLGLKKPSSVGIAGSKLTEMGFPPKGPAPTEEDDQDPAMGMDEPTPDMGGDDMGGAPEMDPGMGGDDVYDMSDIDPHLLALLGIKLGKAVLKMAGGEAGADPMMGGMGGAPTGDVGGDDGVDLDAMYGGMEDGEGAPEGEEGEEDEDEVMPSPEMGGKAPMGGDKAPFPAAAEAGDDDSDDGEEDSEEDSDDEGSAPPFAANDDDGEEDSTEEPAEDDSEDDEEEEGEEKPNPKFMHKGKKKKEYMCGACGNITKEDADFFNSIFKNGKGNHKETFSNGLETGGVGFAPQGRIGGLR